jgi:hypothetical protein
MLFSRQIRVRGRFDSRGDETKLRGPNEATIDAAEKRQRVFSSAIVRWMGIFPDKETVTTGAVFWQWFGSLG